jgi:hypothetical protein
MDRSLALVNFPVRARKTIWSASPDCAGKCPLRRSTACCEPVPGSVKSLAVLVPIELDIAYTPIAAAIQANTTMRR